MTHCKCTHALNPVYANSGQCIADIGAELPYGTCEKDCNSLNRNVGLGQKAAAGGWVRALRNCLLSQLSDSHGGLGITS